MTSVLVKYGRFSYKRMFHREPPANFDSETTKLFGKIIQFSKIRGRHFERLSVPPSDLAADHSTPRENCQTKTAQAVPYKKLPTAISIRLVSIKPLNYRTRLDLFRTIECSIVLMDLKDSPAFDAMSHTWGDPMTVFDTVIQVSSKADWAAPAFEIICDGKPVSVSSNLYTMLLALRHICSGHQGAGNDICFTKRFWIDALCINQADIDEKSQQIMMMSRIYNCVTCVFIWLGGEDDETGRVLQDLHNLANLDKERRSLINTFILDVNIYKKLGIPAISVDGWVEIYKFYNRAWFSRSCIVREVGLAKQTAVICGLYMFRGMAIRSSLAILRTAGCIEELRNLVEPLIYEARHKYQRSKSLVRADLTKRRIFQPSAPNTPFNPNMYIIMLEEGCAVGGTDYMVKINTGVRPKPLWRILDRFSGFQATDPRDRVYAFMGLSREFFEEGRQLVPKYSQPVEEVYFEAARFIASSVGGLKFLGMKEMDSSLELPS
ncbi:unnamed protein product, partial [Clonostachys chloroleuca]